MLDPKEGVRENSREKNYQHIIHNSICLFWQKVVKSNHISPSTCSTLLYEVWDLFNVEIWSQFIFLKNKLMNNIPVNWVQVLKDLKPCRKSYMYLTTYFYCSLIDLIRELFISTHKSTHVMYWSHFLYLIDMGFLGAQILVVQVLFVFLLSAFDFVFLLNQFRHIYLQVYYSFLRKINCLDQIFTL